MLVVRRSRIAFVLALLLTLLWMSQPAVAQGGVHVVQRGQTLYSIARRYGTTVNAIMQANGLSNSNFVWVGQRLRIPSRGGGSGGGSAVHVVQRGQTLYSIARRYGTIVSAIMRANGLSNSNFVWVGQRLRIPSQGGGSGGGGAVHVVQRGQTLHSIARRYGTTVNAIMRANGLSNPNFVWVGQRLRIPSGGSGGRGGGSAGGSTGRWIEVILSSQRATAWQGNTRMRTMVVSTGIPRYPTPTGRFRIYAKYRSTTMSGPGYYLRGVPHTMFFYRGYALHGTYWHSNFGRPMSHGCVNLTRADAAWLYSWAPAGTLVVIHY